jgi:TonB-linked SusC/RagA family outer membrane protein
MKTRLNVVLSLFFALAVQISFAQERTISGTVSDESGPLPGVSVMVKGSNSGTDTDFDGNYTIQVSEGETLVFSYVGLDTMEKLVGSQTVLNVALLGGSMLDEVVVVAYGTQTKASIVGAVSVVGSEIIDNQQNVSVTSALQGSVPGVNVISGGGQPGTNPTIRIRGIGSVNASADPLIILDGAQFTGNLNAISPDIIESMSVLKDAMSTAIYGSRAANGVIVITTKKGSFDQAPTVSFRATAGIANQAVDLHRLASTDEFSEFTWESMRNGYIDTGASVADAAQAASNNFVQFLGYNPYGTAQPVGTDGKLVGTAKKWDTDWADELINNSAVRQEYSVSVSGGSKNTTYLFSANYLEQEGSVKTSNFERINTRANITSNIKDWLQIGLNTSYSTSNQNFPTQAGNSFQSPIQWAYTVSSYYPLYKRDPNGDLEVDGFGNPIYDYGNEVGGTLNGQRPRLSGENAVGALYNYDIENTRDDFIANAFTKIDFTDNLSFNTRLFYEKYSFDAYEYSSNVFGNAANVGGRVSQNRDFTTTTNITNSLNYSNVFNEKHGLKVDLIQEAFKSKFNSLSAQGTGFLPNVKVLNGATTPENVSGFFAEERLVSYLGRVAYNYDQKYFIEGSYRRDGSSKFASDVRWGGFYAFGGSWIISREGFLENSNVVDNLKLRGSYGELGNNAGIGYFPYLSLFDTGNNEGPNTGVVQGAVSDPSLTWEKTAQTNIGLDFALFNNRLTGSVDWYDKESVDLIFGKPLPPSTGNASIRTNIGSLSNTGWEFVLNSTNIVKDNFLWTSSLNLATQQNEITELTQESIIQGTKRWEVGRSLYDFWLRESAGVDSETGLGLWYVDVLDDNGEPTGARDTTDDYGAATRYYQDKTSLPTLAGGFTNYVRVGNFDLNFVMNFALGAYVYDSTYQGLMDGYSQAGSAASPDLANRWQQPGDITNVPRFTTSQNDSNGTSDRFLFKNDYLRLKALTFGYNFNSSVLENAGVQNLRLYFQGDNLLTFQSHKGIDPEQSIGGTTNSRSYPQRIFSLGAKFNF